MMTTSMNRFRYNDVLLLHLKNRGRNSACLTSYVKHAELRPLASPLFTTQQARVS